MAEHPTAEPDSGHAGLDELSDPAASPWYTVDRQDCLCELSGDWDARLAEGGGAAACRGARILGRPLREFIAGDSTRMYLDAALEATRLTGQPRRLPYRCDTPTLARRMQMCLQPLADGRVRVTHQLLAQQPLPRPLACHAAASAPEPARLRCSLCLRLRTPEGHWLDPVTAAPDVASLAVHYTLCPDCGGRHPGGPHRR
ncbi:MAG: hypothetical protein L6Q75_04070 [Burkholderiaceae bacterium]|nr:hypothetical protein [Burkholderiaceae bacterium]